MTSVFTPKRTRNSFGMKLSPRARVVVDVFKRTATEWLADDAPQLGAALAYYSVFSLAPMVLLLIAVIGVLFRNDPAGAWTKITEQMSYFYLTFDVVIVTAVFAMIFKVLSNAKTAPIQTS